MSQSIFLGISGCNFFSGFFLSSAGFSQYQKFGFLKSAFLARLLKPLIITGVYIVFFSGNFLSRSSFSGNPDYVSKIRFRKKCIFGMSPQTLDHYRSLHNNLFLGISGFNFFPVKFLFGIRFYSDFFLIHHLSRFLTSLNYVSRMPEYGFFFKISLCQKVHFGIP